METTCDAFLGGQINVLQPKKGYRAGIDPVILAAACPVTPGQSVLELGTGVGTSLLCLAARVPELLLAGIEIQSDYLALARQNAESAGQDIEFHQLDIAKPTPVFGDRQFDHVILNPPFFPRARGAGAKDQGKFLGRQDDIGMAPWLDFATARLKSGGLMTLIQKPSRLQEILTALSPKMGSVEILPINARASQEARLILLRVKKGGRADLLLHAAKVMHVGHSHAGDKESYTEEFSGLFRNGDALNWPR